MRWISHIAVGGATCAVVAPELAPVAVLGATSPDWIEWICAAVGKPQPHRGPTHYVLGWIALFVIALAVWDWHGVLAAFAWGGLTHVICDSFTVTGVPLAPWSDRRFHLAGGRLRTGDPGEYVFTGVVVVICAALAITFGGLSDGFAPFFYNWSEMYQNGVIDGSEWKANRWKLI